MLQAVFAVRLCHAITRHLEATRKEHPWDGIRGMAYL